MNSLFYRLISKKIKISEHIEKYEFNMGVMVISIWVVEADGAYYLVDSGIGNMGVYIAKQFLPKNEIEAIFLTHGHSDHIGGINAFKKSNPHIKIYIDSREFPYISGKKAYPRRNNVERKTFKSTEFLPLNSLESKSTLKEIGMEAIFSPGHSPGHNCFYHKKDNVIIAGDLYTTNRKGHLEPPMGRYTADMTQALRSGYDVLYKHQDALLSVCHGTEVKEAFKKLNQSSFK